MNNKNIKYSVETFMVTLLLILFAIMVSILIFEGSSTYKKVLNSKESEENARIALSFINMKIKQNDLANRVYLDYYEGFDNTIVIEYGNEEEGLFSYIYFKDGALYECYSEGVLSDELSTKIVDVNGGSLNISEDGLIESRISVNGRDISRLSAIRTKYERVVQE